MLDLKFIRGNTEQLKEILKNRNSNFDLDEFIQLDETRRNILGEVEALKQRRNIESQEVAKLKKDGIDASEKIKQMGTISEKIKDLDKKLSDVDEKIKYLQMIIPNVYHSSTPIGKDDSENIEVRKWGTPKVFSFEPKPHWELGENLGILDFERGAKLSGARFVLYTGAGARLERALINFMLDTHTLEQGYTEQLTPFMVKREVCEGTGQLPKFEEDMYKTTED
ncbi:MAG: serine--tRNA ligase, partial [Fusobacteriaceae bacterium]|nr:serine--tRNA ligase [Fusobacteriaceae bacterium]